MQSERLPRLPLAKWASRIDELELEGTEIPVTVLEPLDALDPVNSRVRGLLGARLRAAWCTTGAPTCHACPELARCVYGRTFETPSEVVAAKSHGSHAPHPFWLQGLPSTSRLPEGARFVARLVLLGPDRALLPVFEGALVEALESLGPHAQRGRALRLGEPIRRPLRRRSVELLDRARISTRSPLILPRPSPRAVDECPDAPWLVELTRAGVRRLGGLFSSYSPIARVAVDFPDLREVRRFEGSLEPWSNRRFSRRQAAHVPLHGFAGDAVLSGLAISELSPLLLALELTGVGKATSMGFGQISAGD
ncbi:MAG: CRISPR system precrRNA processing endoribonuclease RAMP protein Cas6 [Deltaproteobacteria bacterium]|nr:CRISPR system precrRNA processing endoribonuclease RAMP protein Cas6 [Deltaproteobacteria bacterium]